MQKIVLKNLVNGEHSYSEGKYFQQLFNLKFKFEEKAHSKNIRSLTEIMLLLLCSSGCSCLTSYAPYFYNFRIPTA